MRNSQVQNEQIFLCAPTPELTCFGCCPPIRPHGYDHLEFAGSLRREFSENRLRFLSGAPRYQPIVGYSCWALGFLDETGRRIGCLLHPDRNQGRDLRFLIEYGSKCQRESCLPCRMFSLLPPEGKIFWLDLARGLNAFFYSSTRANPLFHLLLWGPELLESMRFQAEARQWEVTELLYRRPFLLDPNWQPQAHRYIFGLISKSIPSQDDMELHIEDQCRKIWLRLLSSPEVRAHGHAGSETHSPYTHKLPFEADFLDLLRLGLGWRRTSIEKAGEVKSLIDRLATDAAFD